MALPLAQKTKHHIEIDYDSRLKGSRKTERPSLGAMMIANPKADSGDYEKRDKNRYDVYRLYGDYERKPQMSNYCEYPLFQGVLQVASVNIN